MKLLGDGAMLWFPNPDRGVLASLSLVQAMSGGTLPPRAGVHVGPVIERDLDLFGRTVNLAFRIPEVAGAGEVLVSEAVAEAVTLPQVRFERTDAIVLKGTPEPVVLYTPTPPEARDRTRSSSSPAPEGAVGLQERLFVGLISRGPELVSTRPEDG